MSIDKINPKSSKNKDEKEFRIFKSTEDSEETDDTSSKPIKSKKMKKPNKKSKKPYCFSKIFNIKNAIIFFGALVLIYFSVRMIFKPSLSQYPKLDSCFVTSVFKINLCPSNPQYVKASQVSKILIHSILISEDDSFYFHQGIDWNEFQKSFIQNWKSGKFVRGGSTVTQQLVKNIYLTPKKSLTRKFKEILLSQQVEEKYSKSIILEKYLNIIEFGYQIYGIKAASNYYFNKPPSQLNILESLYLTMLMPNPKAYSSSFKTGRLTAFQRERIQKLLTRLLRRKRISLELYNDAKAKISLFPWKNLELNESQKIEDGDLDFINDKKIYLDSYHEPEEETPFNESDPNKFESSDYTEPSENSGEVSETDTDSEFLDVEEIKTETEEVQDSSPNSEEPSEEDVDTYYEKE